MKRFLRLSLCVVVLCGVFVGAGYADLNFAENWGLDFWNYSKLENEFRECKRLNARLSASHEQTQWRLEFRENLIDELLAERSTIDQVVRQFQNLNQNGSATLETLRLVFKSENDRCLAFHQLLLYINARLNDNSRYAALREQVEVAMNAEFPE